MSQESNLRFSIQFSLVIGIQEKVYMKYKSDLKQQSKFRLWTFEVLYGKYSKTVFDGPQWSMGHQALVFLHHIEACCPRALSSMAPSASSSG